MRSRYLLIVLPAFLAVQPAVAQDVVFVSGTGESNSVPSYNDGQIPDRDNDGLANVAEKIADPAAQDKIAAVVERTTSAMMNMPIGQFAEAIERARPGTVDRRIRRNSTVADIAGHDAHDLPQKLGERSRDAMGMMSGFARAMAAMMPEFERMGREMEDSFHDATAGAHRNRN